MNPARSALLSVCILAGAAGCSLGDEPAAAGPVVTPSVPPPAAAAPTSATTAPPAASTSSSTSTTETTAASKPAKPRRVAAFRTPSGNIVCGVLDSGSGSVRCDILAAEVKYTPPPKPASCEFDWGFSFAIKPDGSVDPLCVSDAVEDQNNKPRAGETVLIGQSRCTVETRSVRCVAEGTDGGLFLSPERLESF